MRAPKRVLERALLTAFELIHGRIYCGRVLVNFTAEGSEARVVATRSMRLPDTRMYAEG